MNWGKSIVLAFVGFALFIGVLVTVCVRQQVSLVSEDYYNEELNYQQQIDELTNAARLEDKPVISVSRKQIQVAGLHRGELKLLRPSDSQFDALFMIDSIKTFDLSTYPSGRYNASLRWHEDGKTFLMKESIIL
jgi:hypothetical protein